VESALRTREAADLGLPPPERPSAPARDDHGRVVREPRSLRSRLMGGASPRRRLAQLGLLALLLGAWELVGRHSSSLSFAPPSAMVPAAREMIGSGELQAAFGDSLAALLLGYALAALVGTAVGLAMGWWRAMGRVLDPFVAALYVVPIAAIVPLIIAWSGFGLAARVTVVFLFCLFEILLAANAGVRNIDESYLDVARTFGAGRRDLLIRVVLPASLPFVMVGLRIGASRALKGMVLAEILFAVTGLGGLIVKYAALFRMDKVLVVVVVISLLGICLSACVTAVERRVTRWQV
jgi:ABC-type nitrate/sulfonate/bicarbonate transport system permease component